MGKHTIYINENLESEIREIASKEGWSFNDVIRKHLETAALQTQYQHKINNLEKKIEAIYILIDLIVSEIGYVVGATRASTKSIEAISREGTTYESYIRRISSALKMNFDTPEILERQEKLIFGNSKEV